MNIIIADDDQNLLAMLVPYLEHQGHRVSLAARGDELLRKISQFRVDLIASDINMPGLDGVEIYTRARAMAQYAATPFILWSGLEAQKGRELAGLDARLRFLKKPFGLSALQKAVDELTDMPLFGDHEGPDRKPGLKL